MIKLALLGGAAFLLYKLLGSSSSSDGGTEVTFEVTNPGLDKYGNTLPTDGAGRPTGDAGVDWNASLTQTTIA